MFYRINVFSRCLAFQLHSTCRESVRKLLSRFLQLFSPEVEIFFRCYFRITRRFMLRSQDELNSWYPEFVHIHVFVESMKL